MASRWVGCVVAVVLGAAVESAWAQAERYLPGHKETAWVIEFSPDGSRLVTSDATTMNVWSVPAFTLVAGPYEPGVTTAAFTRDGKRLYRISVAVSVDDVGARVLGNEPLFKLDERTVALASELSADGKLLAVADTSDSVRVIDAATGALRFAVKPGARVLALTFARDGKTLFAASKGGQVIKLDVDKGEEQGRLEIYKGAVRAVASSPDGKRLAVCGDSESWIIDLGSGEKVAPIGLDCAGVEYTSDGKHLVTTSTEGVLVWDTRKNELVRKLGGRAFQGLAVSPDGRYVAASTDAQVRVFDLKLVLGRDYDKNAELWHGAEAPVSSVVALPDNRTVITSSKNETTVWDRKLGVPTRKVLASGPVTIDGKGHVLLMSDPLQLLDPKTGKTKKSHALPPGLDVTGPRALSKKGDLLVVGGPKVELYDLKKAKTRFVLEAPCAAVAFSPKGDQIAAGCDDATVKLLDLSGKEKRLLSGHLKEIVAVTFSDNGKVVASAGKDGSARAWEVGTGKPLYEVAGDAGHVMQSVALSPDGRVLAAGGASGKLTVVDLSKKEKLFEASHFEFVGHGFAGSVADLQFTDKGKTLVSASWNRTVTFWRVVDGAPLQSFGAWKPYELLGKLAGGPRQAASAEKALFFAAQDLEKGAARARAALSLQPPLDYRDGDYTSLMVACEKGNVPVAKLLIAAGAEVNAVRASGENCLTSAVRKGNLELVQALIAGKANVNHVKEPQKETPLIFAAALGHTDVAKALLAAGAEVGAPTADGRTPLMIAVDNDNGALVALLAGAKADVNAPDTDGLPLLTRAARALAENAYAALVTAGADPSKAEKVDFKRVIMGVPRIVEGVPTDSRGIKPQPPALEAPRVVVGFGRPLRTAYRNRKVQLVDPSKVYTNETGPCLSWPSAESESKGEQRKWGTYKPKKGDVGTVVFATLHCTDEGKPNTTLVLIVKVGDVYVPVEETAVELPNKGNLGLQAHLRQLFKDEHEKEQAAWALRLKDLEPRAPRVVISDASKAHTRLNASDCISWPSPVVKARGGERVWGDYEPRQGDEGIVVHRTAHCLGGDVVIVKVGDNYVPVSERGVRQK